jgi:predicted MFS family arabinose efflux permease
MSLFPIAVMSLFFTRDIGMSVETLMVVQAIFGFVIVLAEFPSGYLADRLGYRRTLLIASLVVTAGWVAYARAHTVLDVVLAEVALGVGFAMISGADTALLYESLLANGEEAKFGLWLGRAKSCAQIAEGSSALVAGALYAVSPRLPFLVQIPVWLAAAAVAFAMLETPRSDVTESPHLTRMFGIIRHAALGAPKLRAVMLLGTAFGISTFAPVWLIQLYATDSGVTPEYLGPIWAAANYTVAVGALLSTRLEKRVGLLPVLAGCVALVTLGYLGLGLSKLWFGFGFYFLLTLLRGINGTLLQHEEQKLIPSSDRASYASLRSLMFRLSFVVLGPLVGRAVDQQGQRPVYLALGALFTGCCGLCFWLLWRSHRAQTS